MTTPKPKCRWFQYSLRTLLVVMLWASIGMSWVGVKIWQAKREREAVETIQKFGGGVNWHKLSGPKWLQLLVGVDIFNNVRIVNIAGTKVNDAGLESLKCLPQLQWLDLGYTQITDADLEHLQGSSQLQVLLLSETKVTDAGLKYLDGLSQLRQLSLNGTAVTAEGVRKLQQALPNCRLIR